MEEVDQIILISLRGLGCDISEDVCSITELSADSVLSAVLDTIRVIDESKEYPQSLPRSMSARVAAAADIAGSIKALGYKDDLGYHQLLYPNDEDTRKLLAWLVNQLPQAEGHGLEQGAEGSSTIKQAICEVVKALEKETWTPSFCVKKSSQKRKRFSNFTNLNTVPIEQPFPSSAAVVTRAEAKEQLDRIRAEQKLVTRQVERDSDVAPSILEDNFAAWVEAREREDEWNTSGLDSGLNPKQYREKKLGEVHKMMKNHILYSLQEGEAQMAKSYENSDRKARESKRGTRFADLVEFGQEEAATQLVMQQETEEEVRQRREEEIAALEERLGGIKGKIESVKQQLKTFSSSIRQLEASLLTEESRYDELGEEYRIQKKIFVELLPDAESNIKLLQDISEESTTHLLELATQWEKHRVPLLQQIRELQDSRLNPDDESKTMIEEIKRMREEQKALAASIREQDEEYKEMLDQYKRLPKNVNRAVYTSRILDIVKQVKKQKVDISKILLDTRTLKKDINQNIESLGRTFAVTSEIVFQDAKKDEAAKKAYRVLVDVHEKFKTLSSKVSESGSACNDLLDLEEKLQQIQTRAASLDLEQVQNDLEQVRGENKVLVKQLKAGKA
eukprot:TRINITY_DN1431_c0_g1_i1.p1 TRINITY_DN1431_c0_g1~~TRINITY_DN1431_c0_g1_i1.p1  ORF type:complete len:630 (-),score=263.53 TRINITY_DN1431_c0_g1_i1:167-2026(-)